MRKEEYIQEVISKIENKKARREVEKELSNHIDDRISYYTDAGWDEETANVKAMEHMGEPEKVSEEMSKLHCERRRGTFIALSVVIAVNTVVSIVFYGYFLWASYDISALVFGSFNTVLAVLFNGTVFILARKSNKKDSLLFIPLLGMDLTVILISVLPILFTHAPVEDSPINFLLGIAMLFLSIAACRWSDEEKSVSSVLVSLVSSVPIAIVFIIILTVLYMVVPNTVSSVLERKQNEKTLSLFYDTMPAEKASREEIKLYDISKYKDSVSVSTEKGDTDSWYVNNENINPVKKLREESVDLSGGLPYVYWITDRDGILLKTHAYGEGIVSEEYVISEDFSLPDTEKCEIKKLTVYDIDVTNEFSADELKKGLKTVRYWDSSTLIDVDAVKTYKLLWTFKENDCVSLYKGYLLEDIYGNFCFAPLVRKKINENKYESFGEVLPVDEAVSERLHVLLQDVPTSEEWFSYPDVGSSVSSLYDEE